MEIKGNKMTLTLTAANQRLKAKLEKIWKEATKEEAEKETKGEKKP